MAYTYEMGPDMKLRKVAVPAPTEAPTQAPINNADINNWLSTNAGANDSQIKAAMQQYGVSTNQLSQATGIGIDEVQNRYDSAVGPSSTAVSSAQKFNLNPMSYNEDTGSYIKNHYANINSNSGPSAIADAYRTYLDSTGGMLGQRDTVEARQVAGQYLTSIGVSPERIQQGLDEWIRRNYSGGIDPITGRTVQSSSSPNVDFSGVQGGTNVGPQLSTPGVSNEQPTLAPTPAPQAASGTNQSQQLSEAQSTPANYSRTQLVTIANQLYQDGKTPQEIAQMAFDYGVPYESMIDAFGDEYKGMIDSVYGGTRNESNSSFAKYITDYDAKAQAQGFDPAMATASNAVATTYQVDPTQTVQGLMTGLLDSDSDYMQMARAAGLSQANARGLMNSSMAAGASQAAAIDRALPIAQADAGIYQQQQLANQSAENQIAALNANLNTDVSIANQDSINKYGLATMLQGFDIDKMTMAHGYTLEQMQEKFGYDKSLTQLDIDSKLDQIQLAHDLGMISDDMRFQWEEKLQDARLVSDEWKTQLQNDYNWANLNQNQQQYLGEILANLMTRGLDNYLDIMTDPTLNESEGAREGISTQIVEWIRQAMKLPATIAGIEVTLDDVDFYSGAE